MSITRIPLIAGAQRFTITLGETTYNMRLTFNTAGAGGWFLDIGDVAGAMLIAGIPLVTGSDLLAPYRYLGFGGGLYVTTDRDAGEVPTYRGLGVTSHLYFVPEVSA